MIVAWTRRTRKKYYKMGKEKRSMSEFILELKDVVKSIWWSDSFRRCTVSVKTGRNTCTHGRKWRRKVNFY